MCRLLVYVSQESISLSSLLVHPSHSIMRQSYACRERLGDGLSGLPPAINADGFGIAFYEDKGDEDKGSNSSSAGAGRGSRLSGQKRERDRNTLDDAEAPGVYTSTSPAWSDPNLKRICSKITSRLVFAHIRAASIGSGVSPYNSHPFSAGRYVLMHNGHISSFGKLKKRFLMHLSDAALAVVRGTTDSEHLFAVFLTEVERLSGSINGKLAPEEMQECLMHSFSLLELWRAEAGIAENNLLNVAVSDGTTVIATRWAGSGPGASLYFTSGSAWHPLPEQQSQGAGVSNDGSSSSSSSGSGSGSGSSCGSSGSCSLPSSSSFSSPVSAAASSAGPAGLSISGPSLDYGMVQKEDKRPKAVIIASERLTASDTDWLSVPKNHLLLVHPSMSVLKRPIVLTPLSAMAQGDPRMGLQLSFKQQQQQQQQLPALQNSSDYWRGMGSSSSGPALAGLSGVAAGATAARMIAASAAGAEGMQQLLMKKQRPLLLEKPTFSSSPLFFSFSGPSTLTHGGAGSSNNNSGSSSDDDGKFSSRGRHPLASSAASTAVFAPAVGTGSRASPERFQLGASAVSQGAAPSQNSSSSMGATGWASTGSSVSKLAPVKTDLLTEGGAAGRRPGAAVGQEQQYQQGEEGELSAEGVRKSTPPAAGSSAFAARITDSTFLALLQQQESRKQQQQQQQQHLHQQVRQGPAALQQSILFQMKLDTPASLKLQQHLQRQPAQLSEAIDIEGAAAAAVAVATAAAVAAAASGALFPDEAEVPS